MEINVVGDTDSLKALEPRWHELCARTPNHHYFQTFDWLWAWWCCLGSQDGNRLHVIVGVEANRTVLIWPLVVYSGTPWRVLRWMGRDGDYCDVLVETSAAMTHRLEEAWQTIANEDGYDVLVLDQMPPDAMVRLLVEQETGAPVGTVPSAFIRADAWPDWATYYATLRKRLRRDQAMRFRRLAREGTAGFKIVQSDDEIRDLVGLLPQQKRRTLSEKGDPVVGQAGVYEKHVMAVAEAAREPGMLHLSKLTVDGQVMAAHLGILFKGWLIWLVPAYDLDWKRCAPGRLLPENFIEWCFENGVEVFDFLAGPDPYKYDWATDKVVLETYARPRTLWGRVYHQAMYGATRALVRKVFRALPGGLRNRLIERFLTR